MLFSTEQKVIIIEQHFRTDLKVIGERQYSILENMGDFIEGCPELVFDYVFYNALKNSLQLFREAHSVGRKTVRVRPFKRRAKKCESHQTC